MIDLTLAQATVTSLEAAEAWYGAVFGRPPDRRPMDSLIEWRFGYSHGLQVFHDPERAGRSTFLVGVTDLDAVAARLDDEGIDHKGVQPGGGGRIMQIADPDGNRVVFADGHAAHGRSDQVLHTTLHVDRRLPAPIDRVWEAYADVEQRRHWSVPPGDEVEYEASDFTVGGTDRYRCGPPGELVNQVTTRYLSVDAPHSFVAVNELRRDDAPVACDITRWLLTADGDATIVSMVVQVTSLVGADVLAGYESGHELTLQHLQDFLA